MPESSNINRWIGIIGILRLLSVTLLLTYIINDIYQFPIDVRGASIIQVVNDTSRGSHPKKRLLRI